MVDARGEEAMSYLLKISYEQMKKFRDHAEKELDIIINRVRGGTIDDPDKEIIDTFVNGCIFGFIEAQNAVGDAILKDLNL